MITFSLEMLLERNLNFQLNVSINLTEISGAFNSPSRLQHVQDPGEVLQQVASWLDM